VAITTTAVAGLLAVPDVAWAHGGTGPAATISGFVWAGGAHMLTGWRYLLFVGGILLLAWRTPWAPRLVGLYTAGHAATLFTGTVADWHLDPRPVGLAVTATIVLVGAVGLLGPPADPAWLAGPALGVGLVHGLAMSHQLQNLSLPTDGLVPRVLAFAVGVGTGQLVAILGMVMTADVAQHHIPPLRQPRHTYTALLTIGVVTALTLAVP
jgi:hypothetical protein